MNDIKKITITEKYECIDYGEYESLEIFENHKSIFSVHNAIDSPEDNTLSRDFADCHSVMVLMEKFYNYGKDGVQVEFKQDKNDD